MIVLNIQRYLNSSRNEFLCIEVLDHQMLTTLQNEPCSPNFSRDSDQSTVSLALSAKTETAGKQLSPCYRAVY